MESLQNSLQQFLENRNMAEKLDGQMEQLVEDPVVKNWWADHPELSREELLGFAIKVKEFAKEQANCAGCQGLHECSNLMTGHHAELIRYGKMLDVTYSPCTYQKQAVQETQKAHMIKSHRIPQEILNADFSHFNYDDEQRVTVIGAVYNFAKYIEPGQESHGLYIHGPLGVGKSYLMGAACRMLAKRNIHTYMVYAPDFFREMKAAIAEQRVNEKIEAMQDVPVLIFDDIGAETMSAWIRDEVLGPILQFRMMERLPTLYTSNYDFDELEEHLMYTQRGQVERIEELKAKRIMERIRHYTDEHMLSGYNRRERNA